MRKPDFSRMRKALLLEGEPDCVPLYDIVAKEVKSAFLGKPVTDLKQEVEFVVAAGYDFVPLQIGFRYFLGITPALCAGEQKAVSSKKPLLKASMARYSVFTDADTERDWAEEGEGVITNLDEFESFPWPNAEDFDYSIFEDIKSYLPQGMKVLVGVDGVFTPAWLLMGAETFYLSLVDNPELVKGMFERIGAIQLECIKKVTSFDCVGVLRFNDDIASNQGLLVSPNHLREYFFPWLKQIGDICKKRGLPFMYHTDGNVVEVLEDIINAGVNALHPIQPNAMDIGYLKKKVGDKLCLVGNIDMDVMTRGNPQEVEELVKRNLREIAPSGGYIVGASNSVPEYIPLKNYNAMRKTTLKYGRYPISI